MTDYIDMTARTPGGHARRVRESLKARASPWRPAGDHISHITFRTKAPGVKVADYLPSASPKTMTIVVQATSLDLEVERGAISRSS